MITLIGTGHVFNLSQALLDVFEDKQPEILCIELDKQRYNALMLKQKDPEAYKQAAKNQPILYKMLSKFQEGMANEYGVTAGQEMITTIEYAQSKHLPLAFIDMNAQLLFKRMMQKMTFFEKIKLSLSGIAGLFISKKRIEKEIDKLEDNLDVYINQIGNRFPTIKKVLIDERNLYMVTHLQTASEKFERVIAVIGDGHVPGISELLKKKDLEFETVRLSQLRKKSNIEKDASTASFSIELNGS